ncbi:DUF6520 family protein [Winogradskyella forsetii]|uniref:DUF6520 family protein n=1 Tax=Winogradskyella forsetii TaxID=2686077 RepID=UPI0015BA6D1F|nr:DUF6520 family protein [Winogradskyella forsetii]
MKTKIIKTSLPFLVFMLAIVFAFATEKKPSEQDEALITGYIFQNGLCVQAPKNCDQASIMPCVYNGNQVFGESENSTSCSVPLTHSGL